mgnify:CR=1 FL=1
MLSTKLKIANIEVIKQALEQFPETREESARKWLIGKGAWDLVLEWGGWVKICREGIPPDRTQEKLSNMLSYLSKEGLD